MRQAGITGLIARNRGRTTVRVSGVRAREDLVDRAFLASAPNRLWGADITYLLTATRCRWASRSAGRRPG